MADQGLAKEAARHFKKQGSTSSSARKCRARSPRRSGVEVSYTDASGSQTHQRRQAHRLRRPPSVHQGPAGRWHGRAARRARFHQGRRPLQDQRRERLGGGRLRARPHARAQGQGRGRDGRRHDRRQVRPHELQHHSVGDLHASGNRLGGADRRAGEGQRPRLQDRPVPVRGQRPRARHGIDRRASASSSPRRTTTRSSACTSSGRWPAS